MHYIDQINADRTAILQACNSAVQELLHLAERLEANMRRGHVAYISKADAGQVCQRIAFDMQTAVAQSRAES